MCTIISLALKIVSAKVLQKSNNLYFHSGQEMVSETVSKNRERKFSLRHRFCS